MNLQENAEVAIQTAPQIQNEIDIRLVHGAGEMIRLENVAEKIQSTIVNTIPLWKSQMVIALVWLILRKEEITEVSL